MEELRALIDRARSGDMAAYGQIVRRFQDMAYGYAYSILGDFHRAEDVVQEAFIEAYRQLPNLREPKAFPTWFRTIVFKHCDRITRRKGMETVSLDAAEAKASKDTGPAQAAEQREMHERVHDAVQALPEHQRMVTTLFYINGYSQKEIAEFLDVPVTTVKKRLHDSRKKLRERMITMIADVLKDHQLPREFPGRIQRLLELPRPLDIEGHPVRELWQIFRSCFPGFEIVKLAEVGVRGICLLRPEQLAKHVYAIDSQRVLRAELTSQMFDRWIRMGGGPCKWLAVGRLFRMAQNVSPATLEEHHQAVVLWAGPEVEGEGCTETIMSVASKLLPGIECRVGSPLSHGTVPAGRWYEAPWRSNWINIAGGGVVAEDWVVKAGLDPQRAGAISFAFALERCALIRYGLDNARTLWQPPYVPDGSRG